MSHLVLEDSPLPKPGPAEQAAPVRPAVEPPFYWDALVAVVAEFNDPDPQWWDGIADVTARTLLLAGGPSSHAPQHLFAEALTLLRDGRIVEISVGHQIHRDAPDRSVATVDEFLSSWSPR